MAIPLQGQKKKKLIQNSISFLSYYAISNISDGVVAMAMELEPDYTSKMQCNVHYSKHSRIAVKAQKYVQCSCPFEWINLRSPEPNQNFLFQKQYTDLFALAAEDETSGVGRRGTSGRGRKPPPAKKETNNTNSSNKKNSEPVYNSSDESSEVGSVSNIWRRMPYNPQSFWTKINRSCRKLKKIINFFCFRRIGTNPELVREEKRP